MVLQFLPAVAAGLNLLGGAAGAREQFRAPGPTAAERAQLQAIANQERLLEALQDPDDVIMRNLRAAEEQSLRQASARQLSNLLRATRREEARGRQTFFNPERRDEATSRFMLQQAQAAGPQAQSAAMQRIMDLIGGYRNIGNQQASLIPQQQARQQEAEQRRIGRFGALGDLVGQVGNYGTQLQQQFPQTFSNVYSALGAFG